jgi:cbb3-type cytochrome oxidase cytochrome c subunit
MKNGFAIFFAAFVVLGGSWCAFVLAPELQLGGAKQTSVLNSSEVYPIQRSGDATLGLQIYRANGCAACHTEQVQQDDVGCDMMLTSVGKNTNAVHEAYQSYFNTILREHLVGPRVVDSIDRIATNRGPWPGKLPVRILAPVDKFFADLEADKIAAAGGKIEIQIVALGPDIARGWGLRHSVAEDFLYDYPVQPGSLRAGPDLAGVGAWMPDLNSQLMHLYAPRSVVKDSVMPPFRFLFEIKKIGDAPSPDALNLRKEFAPPAGYEVVPKPEAKELAAYLLSLHADVPLYDAPFTSLSASTNAPANKP